MAYIDTTRRSSIPDIEDFHFDRSYQFGGNVAVWVQYHGCRNYDCSKILVYEACTEQMLLDQGSLDPQFSNRKDYLSPVAMFEPTERGWTWAVVWIECF